MTQIVGEFAEFPWVDLRVRSKIDERVVRFLVDTGFNCELAIPLSFRSWFGAPDGSCAVKFASGERQERGLVACQVLLDDEMRTVDAMYIDGDSPLLGLELLRGFRVTIDVEEGGEVSIEAIE